MREQNCTYTFFSSPMFRASNSEDDHFLLFERQRAPLVLGSPGFIALFNSYKHSLTFAIFTSGNGFLSHRSLKHVLIITKRWTFS